MNERFARKPTATFHEQKSVNIIRNRKRYLFYTC